MTTSRPRLVSAIAIGVVFSALFYALHPHPVLLFLGGLVIGAIISKILEWI